MFLLSVGGSFASGHYLNMFLLLLSEIQKRTEKSQADYAKLHEAILKLEEVMT